MLALGMLPVSGQAAQILYDMVDLPDETVGQDRWLARYTVLGPFTAFESANLLFDWKSFSSIQVAAPSPPSSFVLLLSPADAALEADGQLLITPESDLPADFRSLIDIRFNWTGAGKPSSQPYELLDEQFNVVDVPLTAAIPEAASASMLLAGLGLLTVLGAGRQRIRI